MKKIFLSFLLSFFSILLYSQVDYQSTNKFLAGQNFRPPLDTIINPLWVGEIRIRNQDTAIYIAISKTSARKWARYWDNQIPATFNFNDASVSWTSPQVSIGARSLSVPTNESILFLTPAYAGLFGKDSVVIRGRSANPRVPIKIGGFNNSNILDSVLRMSSAGVLQQVALKDLPADTLRIIRYLDSIYLIQYSYNGVRDSLNQIHVKDLVYRDRYKWDIYEEFIASGFGGNFTATSANSGGAFVVASTVAGRIGEAQIQTSSSANARAAITSAENILFSSSQYTFELEGGLLNSLNNASDSIYLYIGFFDNASSDNTPVDGAYFRYDAGATAWQICTRSNSTETRQTTASTVVTGTDQRFTIVISTSGASFFINGTQVGTTITTNIPSGVGRDVSMGVKIMKRGGTGFRSFNFDRLKFKIGD